MTEAKGVIPIPAPTEINIKDFIADYDTIRLEVSEHSLMANISRIHIMNGKLYITDGSDSGIFIYTMQGKFLAKICNQGEGPEEYVRITGFETDPANNRLLLSDNFSKRLFEYDENGKLLKTISLNFSPTLIASDKSGRYIHLNSASQEVFQKPEMEKNNVHIINAEGKVTETFLEDDTPKRIDIGSACTQSYADNGELLYMPVLSDTIYRIHGSEAIPEYTLGQPAGYKFMTAKEKQEAYFLFDRNNLMDYEADGFLIPYGSFLHSDSLLFLSLGINTNWRTFYSRTKKRSFTLNPKKLQGNKGLCEIFSGYPRTLSGNSIYISVSPIQMDFTLPLLPEGKLKTFFEAMAEDGNPCIIVYRLNEDLFTDKN